MPNCIFVAVLLSLLLANPASAVLAPQHFIIGGSLSQADAWPYMGALLRREVVIAVAGVTLKADYLTDSPTTRFAGTLVNCDKGSLPCSGAEGAVCLIVRGETSLFVKAANCAAGGGVGVLIYNDEPGEFTGKLGQGVTLPVLAITQAAGLQLLNYLGQESQLAYADTLTTTSFCGAAYLGGQWAITAAHCVEGLTAEALLVSIGAANLQSDSRPVIGVAEVRAHPLYSPYHFRYDIALLRLAQAPQGVTPIQLADGVITDRAIAATAPVTVLGRGWQGPVDPQDSAAEGYTTPALYQARMYLVSNDQCNDAIRSYLRKQGIPSGSPVSDDMLCAGGDADGSGVCFGDSGGPLVYHEGGVDYLIGITSWVYGCAQPGLYDGFTRVGYFKLDLDAILVGSATGFTEGAANTASEAKGGGGALHPLLLTLLPLCARRRGANRDNAQGQRGWL